MRPSTHAAATPALEGQRGMERHLRVTPLVFLREGISDCVHPSFRRVCSSRDSAGYDRALLNFAGAVEHHLATSAFDFPYQCDFAGTVSVSVTYDRIDRFDSRRLVKLVEQKPDRGSKTCGVCRNPGNGAKLLAALGGHYRQYLKPTGGASCPAFEANRAPTMIENCQTSEHCLRTLPSRDIASTNLSGRGVSLSRTI